MSLRTLTGWLRSGHVHEVALFALGLSTSLGLVIKSNSLTLFLEILAGTMLYAVGALCFRGQTNTAQRVRIVLSYIFILWFYESIDRITPALGVPLWDSTLYAMDCGLFSETPALLFQRCSSPRLTDLMSGCYLSYHVYLHWSLLHALWRPMEFGLRFGFVFTAFAIGMLGYLLVPAVGPELAFGSLFGAPLRGNLLTRMNAVLISRGSSVYDVFPSLHILIGCVLLDLDWQLARWRFWLMLAPSLGMFASTLYLRYHYAVDLIAGFGLFLGVYWSQARWTPTK